MLAPVPSPAATATPAATPTATVTQEPTPTATVTPGPNLACADRFAVTPSAVVDWFGCDLPGSSDLKSWTNYLQSGVLFPCGGPPGSIVAGFGASQVVAGDVYDHRFPVLSTSTGADGSTTVVLGGHVRYRMPAHGIDEQLGSLRLVIPANGQTGTVYADGHSKTFDMSPTGCTAAPTPYAGVPVLTLDFTGIAPVTAGGVQRWIKVPATIAPGHALIGGGNYAAGSAWGFFTIAVPVR